MCLTYCMYNSSKSKKVWFFKNCWPTQVEFLFICFA